MKISPKPLPRGAYLTQRLDFNHETGIFLWRLRSVEHSPSLPYCQSWNTRYAGKPAGHINPFGYHVITLGKTYFLAHRIAWLMTFGEPIPEEIDHIDGNRANNSISNLRAVTRAENLANMKKPKRNLSGVKGVSFDAARGKFVAHITHLYKHYHLGRFDTFEQAVTIRREAAERMQGKFARHD